MIVSRKQKIIKRRLIMNKVLETIMNHKSIRKFKDITKVDLQEV